MSKNKLLDKWESVGVFVCGKRTNWRNGRRLYGNRLAFYFSQSAISQLSLFVLPRIFIDAINSNELPICSSVNFLLIADFFSHFS